MTDEHRIQAHLIEIAKLINKIAEEIEWCPEKVQDALQIEDILSDFVKGE